MEKALASAIEPSEDSRLEQEAVWISASQAGDALAFNHLTLKWERLVFNLCLRMLGDFDEASEVCQEVFLAAFRNIRKFRRDARFSTWLYRIAANRCLTRLKRRPAVAHYSLDADPGRMLDEPGLRLRQDQESLVLEREKRERILRALAKLPPEQRAVVELKIYQEQKFERIAEIVEAPLSTVKSRFYKSLDTLKRHLGTFKPSA